MSNPTSSNTGLVGSNVDPSVQQALNALDTKKQDRTHPEFTVAPLAGQVPEGGFVLATISGTSYVYTKIGGKLYRTALTAA